MTVALQTSYSTVPASWQHLASCAGQTALFFAPPGERPEARARREARAVQVCLVCPVLEPCRAWARGHREYGFWGGESEDQRATAGFRVDAQTGRPGRLPRRGATVRTSWRH